MSHHFLLEIGLEEMPASVVIPSVDQLKNKTALYLEENRLTFDSIDTFSTPRRLAIRINKLAAKQEDIKEEAKGPAKRIAQDSEGNWSKAAEGFVKGQGLTTEDIFFKEINGVDYVHVTKFVAGKMAEEVLQGLDSVIKSLTFPVTMHWASYDFKFIRPIHWLVALLDDQIIPFKILDVETNRLSRGHRFLGKETEIDHALNYEQKLAAQFVTVDSDKRKAEIVKQLQEIASKENWQLLLDEELLEEVNNLVEYPTAFVGKFDEKYLEVPEEVLVTSMKEHQRYFDVRDASGKLLPLFASVRNGNSEYLDNVIKGNEKVLTARLEDAEFFFNEDKDLSIADCVAKLKHVTFHEKIGTIYEKMQRVGAIAQLIGSEVGLSKSELVHLERASEIYKFDLMTNMISEFPELQGVMGEKYALMQGETKEVAQAIREHYLPTSSEGELPVSKIGAVLAVADKTDSVISFFNVGVIPSGSNDPYALRRQTYGIIRIVEKMGWDFPLIRFQSDIATVINRDIDRFGISIENQQTNVTDFIKGRMKQFLTTRGIRHDIIEAVINAEQSNLAMMVEAATVIKEHHNEPKFKPSIEALTRVINLAIKGQEMLDKGIEEPVKPDLFENQSEKALYEAVIKVETDITTRSIDEIYLALINLQTLIENYFSETMVMADNPEVRANRLRLLSKIANMALPFARLDLLTVKK